MVLTDLLEKGLVFYHPVVQTSAKICTILQNASPLSTELLRNIWIFCTNFLYDACKTAMAPVG